MNEQSNEQFNRQTNEQGKGQTKGQTNAHPRGAHSVYRDPLNQGSADWVRGFITPFSLLDTQKINGMRKCLPSFWLWCAPASSFPLVQTQLTNNNINLSTYRKAVVQYIGEDRVLVETLNSRKKIESALPLFFWEEKRWAVTQWDLLFVCFLSDISFSIHLLPKPRQEISHPRK